MKTCEAVAELLDDFVDGELAPQEAERVREHLRTCPDCRAYVEDALAIRAAFPAVEDTVVPPDFAAGVLDRIHAQAVPVKQTHPHSWKRSALPLAACFALVLGAGVLYWQREPAALSAQMDPNASMAYSLTSETAETEESAAEAAKDVVAPQASRQTPEEPPVQSPHPSPKEAPDPALPDTAPDKSSPAETSPDTSNRMTAAERDAAIPECAALASDDAAQVSSPISIQLSEAEAGDLLSAFTPVEETEQETLYSLSVQEAQQLLDALAQQGLSLELSLETDATDNILVQVLH